MKLKFQKNLIPILIILLNVYFLGYTVLNIITGGGKFGYGLLILPFTISYHLFLLPATIQLIKGEQIKWLKIVNSIGFIWIAFGCITAICGTLGLI